MAEVEHGLGPEQDPDIVGDVNRHTSGTEFYGMSSNFVLLSQLFSHARLHAFDPDLERASSLGIPQSSPSGAPGHAEDISSPEPSIRDPAGAATTPSHLSTGRLSIINLLYNEEATLPPSRPKTPIRVNEQDSSGKEARRASNVQDANSASRGDSNSYQLPSGNWQRNHNKTVSGVLRWPVLRSPSESSPKVAEQRLEKEFLRIFFNNLHHLHPFLLVEEFTSRCEDEIWKSSPNTETPRRDRKHFLALYNITVAVGALIAGKDTILVSNSELPLGERQEGIFDKGQSSPSSMNLSVAYFRKSRISLGDVFEVCSLESAQTLFLMVSETLCVHTLSDMMMLTLPLPSKSLYCQNALKPHSCYMYSGMAVRTALAIGLPSESMSKSRMARKAARRTWW